MQTDTQELFDLLASVLLHQLTEQAGTKEACAA